MHNATQCRPEEELPSEAAPAVNHSLDPEDWTELRAQAHRMLDDMLGYMEGIRTQPVWKPIPGTVRATFQHTLPTEPTPLEEVHAEFMTSILPFTARNGHPGFMGWVQGGGTPVGMLAEMLAAGLNANVGGRDQIPLDVERQITQWIRSLFGFPEGASGLFVTGTSMATLIAVKVARDARLGGEVRRQGMSHAIEKLVCYASEEVHGCIASALDLVGLGSDALRLVAVDRRHRMDMAALMAMVEADRGAGYTPFLVVGTSGTVNTGAIDDLDGIAEVCAREHLWFHVDGACGALAMLAPELAPRLRGIERADSIAFDFHKWAQVPYDAGFLLVRDGKLHQEAFTSADAYLARETRGMAAGSPWPCDFGPDLSRGFRALKVWASLKVYGTNAIGAVIAHTCELARYLESRIAAIEELELLAPVELNVVCFRYRGATNKDAMSDEFLNRLNRQIAITMQESGAVAPSTTTLNGRLAIRAAIVNHRTTRVEIDTLIEAVERAGERLGQETSASRDGTASWGPWLDRTAKLHQIDAKLGAGQTLRKEDEVELRYKRAMLLAQLGRTLEARTEHLKVVSLAPSDELNLNALGLLLASTGNKKAGLLALCEAVRQHPKSTRSLVNFGGALLEERDDDSVRIARQQFEAALAINPKMPQAHAGLYYALTRLGEFEAAEPHHRIGFQKRSCFTSLYRGNAEPVPVVLLVSSTGGNTPIEKLIDDSVFQTHVLVADFYDRRVPLPPHRLIVNGIGDADVSEEALIAAEAQLARSDAPVINSPAAVRVTGRCENAARLRGIPGVVAPSTRSFPYAALAGADGAVMLMREGFAFPLLLRAPGFHMGEHFVRVESACDLAAAVAELPGADVAEAELLAIEYLDAQGADGCSRKYRVMMIDGRLYPLHLAVSTDWKIHYFNSDMVDEAEHRSEEAEFLADMAAVLGPRTVAALECVQAALGLDYAGIDFGLGREQELLLFEANATMVVQHPDDDERWDYRRSAVDNIHAAVRRMLMRRAGVVTDRSAARNSVQG